ncbi:MAG: hypothetical protein J7605_26625 [Variovorax sp.]|nr:hypothetical protein [Variovorax sp.]
MSIALTPYDDGKLCYGSTWTVRNLDALAEEIARVAVGQAEHIAEIFTRAGIAELETTAAAVNDATELLSVTDQPYHRDGWLFQVMSWIAAHRAAPGSLIRAPHMLLAHKGFDGLQIEVGAKNTVLGVVIFEDKATENPRETVRHKVWPEFRELELGKRQNLLAAEVASLLKTVPAIDATAALKSIIWAQVRKYRVAVTVDINQTGPNDRAKIFENYDDAVPGLTSRRRGETMPIPSLRQWMDTLAQLTISKLAAIPLSNV